MNHPYRSAIVHLSDIECGEKNRAHTSLHVDGYIRCADRLIDDLRTILFDQDRYAFSAGDIGLVVTGDVAGRGTEYEDALALLRYIRKKLGIPGSQVAVVPGNHDVNWVACEKAFTNSRGRGKANEMPEKFGDFSTFLQSLCKKPFRPEAVLRFDGFAALGVALVGFDSCYPCSFRKEDNYGQVRDIPIAEAGQRALKELLSKNERLIPMAMLHHNVMPLQADDPSVLKNHREAREWFRKAGFGVCLCGHEHGPTEVDNKYEDIYVSVTGSYGLNSKGLSESSGDTNKYRIVLINPGGESRILLRQLDAAGSFDGNWRKDGIRESIDIRFRRPQLPVKSTEELKAAVCVKPSRAMRLHDGRFVVAFRAETTPEALRCIDSIVYDIDGHSVFAEDRESGFLVDTIVDHVPTYAYPRIESTSGLVELEPIAVTPLVY